MSTPSTTDATARLTRTARTLLDGRTLWLLLGFALLARTLLAYRGIEQPGLQYDEVLFVNAATDRQPGLFIFKELGGVPTMVFPYIGALKSWLFTPVFWLFDPRPATIRMPMVVLTSAAIGLLFVAVRSLVDRRTALLVFAAIVLDSTVFWLTRGDAGPSAIEFACKCGALLCIARIVATRSPRWTAGLLVVLALGVFNKLNFVWVVNGIVAASGVLLLALRGAALKPPWRPAVVTWVAGLTGLYAVFGWYYLHFDIGSYNRAEHPGSLLGYTWPLFTRGTSAALGGTSYRELAIGPQDPRTLLTLLLLALFAAGTVLSLTRRQRCWPVAALSLVTLLVAAQTLVVASATAPWHYMGPLPYGTVVAAYGVVGLLRLLSGERERIIHAGLGASALAVTLLGLLTYSGYRADMEDGQQTTIWTPLIYKADEFADRQPGTLVTADWGIFNQIWALSPGTRPRMREEAFTIQGGNAASLATSLQAAGPPVTVLVHGPGHDIFPGQRQRLLDGIGSRLQLIHTIPAPDGSIMYEAYRFR